MKRYLPLLLLLSTMAIAATAPATITLTRPTTYTDGSTLAAADISGYNVTCEFTATGSTLVTPCSFTGNPLPGGTATGGPLTLTYPAVGGTACFFVQTMVGTSLSAKTPSVCKPLAAVAPSPPSNVTVTVTIALNLKSDSPITVALVGTPIVTKTP